MFAVLEMTYFFNQERLTLLKFSPVLGYTSSIYFRDRRFQQFLLNLFSFFFFLGGGKNLD